VAVRQVQLLHDLLEGVEQLLVVAVHRLEVARLPCKQLQKPMINYCIHIRKALFSDARKEHSARVRRAVFKRVWEPTVKINIERGVFFKCVGASLRNFHAYKVLAPRSVRA
jgi:hypothetical protein